MNFSVLTTGQQCIFHGSFRVVMQCSYPVLSALNRVIKNSVMYDLTQSVVETINPGDVQASD